MTERGVNKMYDATKYEQQRISDCKPYESFHRLWLGRKHMAIKKTLAAAIGQNAKVLLVALKGAMHGPPFRAQRYRQVC